MKVRAYRNLNQKCWSAARGREPVDWYHQMVLLGVTFRVQPGGKARVQRTGRKNVHAFVVGTIATSLDGTVTAAMAEHGAPEQLHYDPHLDVDFYVKRRHTPSPDRVVPVSSAVVVLLDKAGQAWGWGVKETDGPTDTKPKEDEA